MNYTQYGELIVNEHDLCDLLYANPSLDLTKFLVEGPMLYNAAAKQMHIDYLPLNKYTKAEYVSVEDFDAHNQAQWLMPDEYKQLDIAEWILQQCNTQEELQRVGTELMMFQDRNLFDLLRFMKYLVDTLRKHNIVWGVGRGSSVASYVLFLIGVHKIDSLYYDLNIEEFLK